MWDLAIWAALGLGALAGIAAAVLLSVRALEARRGFEDTRRAILRGLDDIAATAGAVADKVAAAGDTANLRESLARLRVSLARLAVLRAALAEAQDTFHRTTAVVPRK
jgi:hypothetical protein